MKAWWLCFILFFSISASATEVVYGEARVSRVIDGDTISVLLSEQTLVDFRSWAHRLGKSFPGGFIKETKIRLGAINTPESVHRDRSKNTPEGIKASVALKEKLHHKSVNLECWSIGKYNRLICSVLSNNKDMGLEMIKEGHSPYVTCWGRHPVRHNEYLSANNGKEYCHFRKRTS